MLSLLLVCGGVIKFHLSPTHTYTSSTFPIDHDLVVKNQHTNKDQNELRPRAPSPTHFREKADISLLCLFHAE